MKKTENRIRSDAEIMRVLKNSKTIAIVGLSPDPAKDSHRVAKYLQKQGYRIIPVRPGKNKILGEKVYSSLDQIQEPVDIINVFRKSSYVFNHAKEALKIMPKVFWMQLNIKNSDAADLLGKENIKVVMNRCIKVEHGRLCK